MKSCHRLFHLVLVVSLALMVACSSTPISRIDKNRAAYESWPIEIQEAVLNGKVVKGMTPQQVEMALGKPSRVVKQSTTAGDTETWTYNQGGGGSSGSSAMGGGGRRGGSRGGSRGGGRSGRGSSANQHDVVFANGVVSTSDFPP